MKSYGKEKKELVGAARQQLKLGFQREKTAVDDMIAKVMERSAVHFYDYFQYNFLLENDSLENLIRNVVDRIVTANHLDDRPRYIFISRSPDVNAHNYGNGVFIVTIGLIGRIKNVDELAFTLAHEIAHDELDHVYHRVKQQVEYNFEKRSKEQVKGILTGTVRIEDIDEFRKLVYGVSRYSRSRELSADSLGIIYCRNAGFVEKSAIDVLATLENPTKPERSGVDFFQPLNTEKFPIQDYWFHKRLSLYNKKPQANFIFMIDSVESHPDAGLRRQILAEYISDCCSSGLKYDDDLLKKAEFEVVESSYRTGQYDWCLFQALNLFNEYPNNRYLVRKITEVLYKLYSLRSELHGYNPIQQFTAFYSDELLLLNNMLQNMTVTELKEMGFHFINDPTHFHPDDKDHHYLLWKLAEATNRKDVKSRVQADFRSRFGSHIKDHKMYKD